MSRLRFNVGDLARFIGPPRKPQSYHLVGAIVEVVQAGPFAPREATQRSRLNGGLHTNADPVDYVVAIAGGGHMFVCDASLAPIDPPAEPASLTRDASESLEVFA